MVFRSAGGAATGAPRDVMPALMEGSCCPEAGRRFGDVWVEGGAEELGVKTDGERWPSALDLSDGDGFFDEEEMSFAFSGGSIIVIRAGLDGDLAR